MHTHTQRIGFCLRRGWEKFLDLYSLIFFHPLCENLPWLRCFPAAVKQNWLQPVFSATDLYGDLSRWQGLNVVFSETKPSSLIVLWSRHKEAPQVGSGRKMHWRQRWILIYIQNYTFLFFSFFFVPCGSSERICSPAFLRCLSWSDTRPENSMSCLPSNSTDPGQRETHIHKTSTGAAEAADGSCVSRRPPTLVHHFLTVQTVSGQHQQLEKNIHYVTANMFCSL